MDADLFLGVLENHTLELRLRSKIQDQSYFGLGGSQVMQELSFVGGVDRATRLQLENHHVLYQKVSTKVPDTLTTEPNLQRYLPGGL